MAAVTRYDMAEENTTALDNYQQFLLQPSP